MTDIEDFTATFEDLLGLKIPMYIQKINAIAAREGRFKKGEGDFSVALPPKALVE